jgi:pilus assembly protein Flp/PilA
MRHLHVLTRRIADEAGATAIEYVLVVALISVAAVAGYSLVGTSLSKTFNAVASAL